MRKKEYRENSMLQMVGMKEGKEKKKAGRRREEEQTWKNIVKEGK